MTIYILTPPRRPIDKDGQMVARVNADSEDHALALARHQLGLDLDGWTVTDEDEA